MDGSDIPDSIKKIFADGETGKKLFPVLSKHIAPRVAAYEKDPRGTWIQAETALLLKATHADYMLVSLKLVYDEILKDAPANEKLRRITKLLNDRAEKTKQLATVSAIYGKGKDG